MRVLLGFALLLPLWAETEKPVCDKTTSGRFWPDEANYDKRRMFELSRRGELELCATHGRRRATYQWEIIGVTVIKTVKPEASSPQAKVDTPSQQQ